MIIKFSVSIDLWSLQSTRSVIILPNPHYNCTKTETQRQETTYPKSVTGSKWQSRGVTQVFWLLCISSSLELEQGKKGSGSDLPETSPALSPSFKGHAEPTYDSLRDPFASNSFRINHTESENVSQPWVQEWQSAVNNVRSIFGWSLPFMWNLLELQSIAILISESKTYFYNWDYLKLSCSIWKLFWKMFENQDIKSTFYLLCGHFFSYLQYLPSVITFIKSILLIRINTIFSLFIANFVFSMNQWENVHIFLKYKSYIHF